MTDPVVNNTPKKLSLHKRTLEMFAAETTVTVMGMKERLHQRKQKVLEAVPLLKKVDDRLHAFNAKMEKRFGQFYTKLRDSARNIARTVLAAELFGIPGVVGMCAYKTCEKAMSLLEPAKKAAERGEADGIFDYLAKNKDETGFTMTSGALSIASAACDVAGAPEIKDIVRMGKASLLIAPEVKALINSTGRWIQGKETFKEVRRNAAVAGITFGTYFVSDVPMTRGSGKPKTQEESQKAPEPVKEGESYSEQVGKLFAAGFGNPGGFITVPDPKVTVGLVRDGETSISAVNKEEDRSVAVRTAAAPAKDRESSDSAGKKEDTDSGMVQTAAAETPKKTTGSSAAASPAKKEEYKYAVAEMLASGAGNPGGMITVFNIKNHKGGR